MVLMKKYITTIKNAHFIHFACLIVLLWICRGMFSIFMHLLSLILLSKRLPQFWIRDGTLGNVAEVRLSSFKPWFLCEYIYRSTLLISSQRSPSETLRASSQWRHGSDESSWLQSGQDGDRNIAEVVETIGGEWHHLARVFSCICLIITVSIKSSYLLLSWREHWVHGSSFECSEHRCCW